MNKLPILIAALLAGCATTDVAPEVITETRTIEKLVPVLTPCDEIIIRVQDSLEREAVGLEDKVDRQLESDATLRRYVRALEEGFIACGGEIKEQP